MTLWEIRNEINEQSWFNITTLQNKKKLFSRARFWSSDVWVMGQALFHCATLLLTNNYIVTEIWPPAIRSSTIDVSYQFFVKENKQLLSDEVYFALLAISVHHFIKLLKRGFKTDLNLKRFPKFSNRIFYAIDFGWTSTSQLDGAKNLLELHIEFSCSNSSK